MSEESEAIRYPSEIYGKDVVPSDVRLGQGWHALERFGLDRFRWVQGDADALFVVCGALLTILIDAEPGPSSALPARVAITVGDVVSRVYTLTGRQTIHFVVPPMPVGIERFIVRVLDGGSPVEGEPRILDLRIFRIAISRRVYDVVPVWDGFDVRRGWYLPEMTDGESYRWVNTDAHIEMTERHATLELDVEPGAASAYRPVAIEVDVGNLLAHQRFELEHRTTIVIEIPEEIALPVEIVLRSVESEEPKITIGSIGNFRVYRYRTPAERASDADTESADADSQKTLPVNRASFEPPSFNPYFG